MAAPTTATTLPASYTIVVSQDDNSNSSDSIVALAALIFAATAFIIAFLQALLQYLTSAQRDKCLRGSIGGWSALTKTRWDFKRWRISVEYARLDFRSDSILKARAASELVLHDWITRNGLTARVSLGVRLARKNSFMRKTTKLFLVEHDGLVILNDEIEPMDIWDLTFSQKLSWIWFTSTKRKNSNRATMSKASWANILKVLNVMPEESLVTEYESADIIHSGLDVPIQIVKLFDLCMLCYMLNFKDVKMDANKGQLQGQNGTVRVETQVIPGLGQVVNFDGDFNQLSATICNIDTSHLRFIASIAKGEILSCGHEGLDIEQFDEVGFLYGAVRQWSKSKWDKYHSFTLTAAFDKSQGGRDTGRSFAFYLVLRALSCQSFIIDGMKDNHIIKVSPRQQAKFYADISETTSKSWTELWTDAIGSSSPTIIKYLAFMPFLAIWSAAPLDLFFSPYYSYLEERRKIWLTEIAFSGGNLLKISQHPQLDISLIYDEVDFLPLIEGSLGTLMLTGVDLHTWAWYPSIDFYYLWDSDIVEHICERLDNPTIYLPTILINLMHGISLEQARQDVGTKISLAKRHNREYTTLTLEGVIMFGLFTVDARLQALWCALGKEEEDQIRTLYRQFQNLNYTSLSEADKDRAMSNFINSRRSFKAKLEPSMAEFMALWFEIGKRTDLLGSIESLQQCLTEIMDAWKTDSTSCIPEPERHTFQNISTRLRDKMSCIDSTLRSPHCSKSKKEFVEWVSRDTKEGVKRLDHVRRMIPLLQLRIFLMDLSYRCHSDSSQILLAKDKAAVDVRLI
ncbi:hypothetical protein ABW20_dc0103482 [Dactylellina cionopaga]|nr:hypothetical protein ABW20_dc0103482 [Dactylellina cionopaga]